MNIGFDAKRLFSNYTGLGNYSRTLVENLSQLYPNHRYSLFAKRLTRNKRTEFFFHQQNIKRVPPISKFPLWRSLGIKKQIKEQKIDVFHGLSAELPFGLKIPSVVTIHDLIFETHPHQYTKIDQAFYSYKAKRACKEASKIIAISEATKKDILQFYNVQEQKIDVIYQTCDDIFFAPISTKKQIEVEKKYNLPNEYLLYVGSVIERKNLLELVKAVEQSNCPPLVVIGSRAGSYGQMVEEYVINNNLKHRVLFMNDVSFQDFPAIYKGACIFIYPSYYEGFGIPVIEAQAVGTPVITSNLSCLPEAGGKHSILLNDLSNASIKDAIENLMNNSEKRLKMSQNGVDYVQKFHKQKVTNQLYSLYKSIS